MAWYDDLNNPDFVSKAGDIYKNLYIKGNDEINISSQSVYSKPEYTVIDETEETVFVQDENGAPHVFTREEWDKMQGSGGAGLLAVVAIAAAGLLLL